jgi:hypothetical protein
MPVFRKITWVQRHFSNINNFFGQFATHSNSQTQLKVGVLHGIGM